jgi:hypothetical protein
MPSPAELKFDPITADWTYIRWLGDRKGIEEQTTTWDKTVVDRTTELSSWVDYCYQIKRRGVLIYAYANNHYAGHFVSAFGLRVLGRLPAKQLFFHISPTRNVEGHQSEHMTELGPLHGKVAGVERGIETVSFLRIKFIGRGRERSLSKAESRTPKVNCI